MQDCWQLLAGRREHYLSRGEREPETAYRRRVEAALPSGFFRDALRTFAGMLASSHWRALPASLQAVISDVDGRGTDLGVFLEAADLLERRDVLDWRKADVRSLPVAISWRERRLDGLPADAGNASSQEPPLHPWIYRTASLTAAGPGGAGMDLITATLVADPQSPSGWRWQRLEQRHYRGLRQLPAIWYASHGAAFGEGELPHVGLAHQYLNHFRCQSDDQELLYRTALPVGVRTGVAGPLGSSTGASQQEPVVLGPNTVLDLPEGASFQFVEIQARSLAEHRACLESLDQGMRRDALIPAAAQGAPRTAIEISMAASQAYALLQSQAIQKASMFSSLLQHWCAITGEPLPVQDGPALLVEISPLAPAPKPQPTVTDMLQLHERGIVSDVALRQWRRWSAGIRPGC